MASCHTPVANGQYITTHSERMKRLRKNIVELVLTNYPIEKLKTEDHGANELYNVVQQTGFDMDSVRYPKGALPLGCRWTRQAVRVGQHALVHGQRPGELHQLLPLCARLR